ncbi:MAG: invasion associated locus B family protein [Paracoccaceae bacterium]
MGWIIPRGIAFTMVMVGLTLGTGAKAQELAMIEAITDWSVYVDVDENQQKLCFIVSQPTKSVARRNGQAVTVSRGDIRFHISVMPEQGVASQPSFLSGYPLKSDGVVKIAIGSTKFKMFPDTSSHKEYAWTTPADDVALIAAMRKGAEAIVTGISERGTTTTDYFSLRGFTAAVEKAMDLCK